jgi:hypothetical protein
LCYRLNLKNIIAFADVRQRNLALMDFAHHRHGQMVVACGRVEEQSACVATVQSLFEL